MNADGSRTPRAGRREGRRRFARRAAASTLGGTLIYLVMVGSLGAWALAQGALFAAIGSAIATGAGAFERGRRRRGGRRLRRVFTQLPDLVVRQVVQGSLRVAQAVVGLAPLPRGARVTVPLRDEPDVPVLALALLETLSPGTYLVDVDEERRALVFHLFDPAEADALVRRAERLLGDEERDGCVAPAAGEEG